MNIIGKFSLKDKSKWLDLSLFLWIVGLAAVWMLLDDILGTPVREIGLGKALLVILICATAVVVIHEGLHGLFFMLFGGKVSFGLKWTKIGPAAYATSTNLYSKIKFQITALAPQIFTLALLVLFPFVSNQIIRYAFLVSMVCNLGGGFLDLYLVFWLRKFPKECFIKDSIGGAEVYK